MRLSSKAFGVGLVAVALLSTLMTTPPAQAASALQVDNLVTPTSAALPVYAYTPMGYTLEEERALAIAPATDPATTTSVHQPNEDLRKTQAAKTAANSMLGADNPAAKVRQGLVRGTVTTPGTDVELAEQKADAVTAEINNQQQQQAQQQAMAQNRAHTLTNFIKNYNKRLSWEQANTIAEAILEYSNKYHVDFRIVTSVIAVESGFRSNAVSSSGAIGLGQLKPSTAKWLGVANPYDPIDNVAGCTRYISYLLKKYNGSVDHALSGYFQGPGTTDRHGITSSSKYYLLKVNRALTPLVPLFNR